MSFTTCNRCDDFLEDDAYCFCCLGALEKKLKKLEKENSELRQRLAEREGSQQ